MATYSSFLVWRIPWMEEPGRLQFMGSKRVRHNWATSLFFFSIFDVHHQTSVCRERLWWKKNFFINKFFETQRKRIIRSTACTSQEHHWNTVPLKTTWQIPILFIDYLKKIDYFSVQFSRLVLSDLMKPHEPQHARLPCPSPTPGVHPNPCPSSWWCHPTISFSEVPFSSCPQSFPASVSCPMSQLFASGGQNIGVSASTSVLPMNTQDWCPLGWTCWISLQSMGLSRVFSNTTVQKHQLFTLSFIYDPILISIHDYWKDHSFD